MRVLSAVLTAVSLLLAGAAPPAGRQDTVGHPRCAVCGTDRAASRSARMLIDYREGAVGTCSIRCTGADLAANRQKTVVEIHAADHTDGHLVPAKTAVWVIGGDRPGVMTQRAKWAFARREDAEACVRKHGGRMSAFEEALKAAFEDMHQDDKTLRAPKQRLAKDGGQTNDIRRHPECLYCGMDRDRYSSSRMLVLYANGQAAPTCSIHCSAIDLALHPFDALRGTYVGDHDTRILLDAGKAFWVLGGDRRGVMSIRGKWAFGERAAAERFVKEHGGALASYDDVMKAAYEDLYEILR